MSYIAYVNCRCYRDGKTSDPPHKEYLHIGDGEDEDNDDELWFEIPGQFQEKNKELAWQMKKEFELWRKSACEHENMEILCIHIANIYGMNDFKYLVENSGGKEKFPVLTEYLPIYNGGCLPWRYAQDALKEIEILETMPQEYNACLKRKNCDTIMWHENIKRNVPFAFGDGHFCSVGGLGFCVVQVVNKESVVKFNSFDFTQKKIDEDKYLFIDNTNSTQYLCGLDADSTSPEETSKEFEVVIIPFEVRKKYEHFLTNMKKLLYASLETNHSVRWA